MLHKRWFRSERVFLCITHYKPGGKWDLQTLWRVPETNIVLVNMTAVVRNQPWESAAEQLRAGIWSLQPVAYTTGCKMKLSPSPEPVELSCRQPFISCCAAENFLEPVVMKAWSFISGGPETSLPPYSPQSHLVDNTWVWVNVGHLLKFLEHQSAFTEISRASDLKGLRFVHAWAEKTGCKAQKREIASMLHSDTSVHATVSTLLFASDHNPSGSNINE